MRGCQYPEESDLEKLKNWDFSNSLKEMLDFIEELWNHDYGVVRVTGKRIKKIYFATGGWSGNEDVMAALRGNHIFWMMFWQQSKVGGAFWFRISKS